MENIIKIVLFTTIVALVPALLITIVWITTLGSFNIIEILHDNKTIFCSSILAAAAFMFATISLLSEEYNN